MRPMRTRPLLLAALLVTSLFAYAPAVAAVGQNQTDMNGTGDLPDNMSSPTTIPNFIFTGSLSGSGDLVSQTDDDDYLRVGLSANQGLAVQLDFNSIDDFDLALYDANQNLIDSSWANNPETVTTNGSTHGGMVYVHISAYSYGGFNPAGTWNLTLWKFTTSSTGGGGGSLSNGSAPPSPCTGNNTVMPDILEPNDSTSTATLASALPLDCTGLSIDSATDVDFFEVVMTTGTTYYVNITFTHTSGDIDAGWDTASGTFLDSSTSVSNTEFMSVTSLSNQTTYIDVYGYTGFGGTTFANTYDIEITTDNPGGGQTYQLIEVDAVNTTTTNLTMSSLTNGDTYRYNVTMYQTPPNGTVMDMGTTGTTSFTASGTGHNASVTHAAPSPMESDVCVRGTLSDANGTFLVASGDCYYLEMLELATTSSTSGEIDATNLTVGDSLRLWWAVLNWDDFDTNMSASQNTTQAIAASAVNETTLNFTASAASMSWSVTWTGITTMDEHGMVAILSHQNATVDLETSDGFIGWHSEDFVPQLPALVITSVTKSTTATTNDVDVEGLDLVPGDDYRYRVRLTDAAGATLQNSTLGAFTASAQNMTLPTWSYTTPNASGTYCAVVELYSDAMVQLIGDRDCFALTMDYDGDGVANELDLCPNTATGAMVDSNGCSLAQKDTDGDGYNDAVDMFPNNPDQHWDTDGDGYGDNSNGTQGDLWPGDASQWADADGDGYGDNASGTNPDAFPLDGTQWSDTDGDGYGDNPNGNNADLWPNDASQWADTDGDGYGDNPAGTLGDAFPNDASQWSDADGDGYGDNLNGTTPDLWPNDGSQWHDTDGDGYGDNPSGTDGDAFPADATQWKDRDGDGYGDNMNGNDPDAFPDDSTQWADRDSDGYGDNAAGQDADDFPDDATQWRDRDGDGYGDEINGNNPDLCPDTPAGESVDENGCADVERDQDEDGVTDDVDNCPDTNPTMSVDALGCAEDQKDSDLDGIMNLYDACPNSPVGRTVDASGCALVELDTDQDGIDDERDLCPTTTPGMSVDGTGCAADERDADTDGVMDADDDCPYTDDGEEVDDHGCAANQRDSDGDTVSDAEDACPMTLLGTAVDAVGCAAYQLDADRDGISDAVDECPATPEDLDVNVVGCAASQLDEDNDGRSDAVDACPMTPAGAVVDILGCAKEQLDTDGDGIHDGLDACPNTANDSIVNADGCAKAQLDSDNDGVNDEEDDFPTNATASSDRDGDGVADQFDAYPDDPMRSTLEPERNSSGLILGVVALLVIAGLAGLLVARRGGATSVGSGLAGNEVVYDASSEQAFADDKALPDLEGAAQPQQWEENGVHWNRAADGSLSFYDAGSGQWVPYQG